MSVIEVYRASERLAHCPARSLATFGRYAPAVPVVAAFDHPHFTLVLPDLSGLTLARLERCFDAPIPNPPG